MDSISRMKQQPFLPITTFHLLMYKVLLSSVLIQGDELCPNCTELPLLRLLFLPPSPHFQLHFVQDNKSIWYVWFLRPTKNLIQIKNQAFLRNTSLDDLLLQNAAPQDSAQQLLILPHEIATDFLHMDLLGHWIWKDLTDGLYMSLCGMAHRLVTMRS